MLLLVVRASKDTSAGMLHYSHQQRERRMKNPTLTHSLLLYSTSSTRMLAVALIKANDEPVFAVSAYKTPKYNL